MKRSIPMHKPHVYATALHRRFGKSTGLSKRHFLAWGYLAHLSLDVQRAYGEGRLSNADIIKMVEQPSKERAKVEPGADNQFKPF